MDLKSENFFGLEEKSVFSVFLGVFKFFCFLVIHWFLAVSLSGKGWPHQRSGTVSMTARTREDERYRRLSRRAMVTAATQGWSIEIPWDGSGKRQKEITFQNKGSGPESLVLVTKL